MINFCRGKYHQCQQLQTIGKTTICLNETREITEASHIGVAKFNGNQNTSLKIAFNLYLYQFYDIIIIQIDMISNFHQKKKEKICHL